MSDDSPIRHELEALRAARDLLRGQNATSDLPHTSRAIPEAARRVEGIDSGGNYLVDQESGRLRLAVHHGLPPQFVERTSHYPADAPEAVLVRAGQAIYLDQAALEVMTTPLGGAIARAQVEEAIRHRRDVAEGVIRTARAIILVLDPEGRIGVTSAPGEGTTFTLRLRAAPPRVSESPAAPARLRILLVDDEASVRSTLASLLRAVGHAVVEADGGEQGLVFPAEHAPELVITDLGMPGMTGWEVAQRVKGADPRLPVILLTGWGQQATGTLLGQGGVDRVLAKPIRLEELQAAIAGLLARPGGGRG